MNATASSYCQPKGVWEGRDAHITAKATDSSQELERLLDPSGVGVVADTLVVSAWRAAGAALDGLDQPKLLGYGTA